LTSGPENQVIFTIDYKRWEEVKRIATTANVAIPTVAQDLVGCSQQNPSSTCR